MAGRSSGYMPIRSFSSKTQNLVRQVSVCDTSRATTVPLPVYVPQSFSLTSNSQNYPNTTVPCQLLPYTLCTRLVMSCDHLIKNVTVRGIWQLRSTPSHGFVARQVVGAHPYSHAQSPIFGCSPDSEHLPSGWENLLLEAAASSFCSLGLVKTLSTDNIATILSTSSEQPID